MLRIDFNYLIMYNTYYYMLIEGVFMEAAARSSTSRWSHAALQPVGWNALFSRNTVLR